MKSLLNKFDVKTSVSILIIAAIVLVTLCPLLFIWCINTLFSTGIAYSFETWLAALIFGFFISSFCGNKS